LPRRLGAGFVDAEVSAGLQLNGIKDLDYLADKYRKSTLSIGVDLKSSIAAVANGKSDAEIDALLNALTAYNRPVFLRLGYGFDNPANKYAPDIYVSAWKKIHERIQAKGSTSVALVWESASCEESNIADWYPGDEYVDWVGANYECADEAIQFAREHLKPVMLTAKPQDAGWDEWFAPFFRFVTDNNDVVRAVTYINDIQLTDEIIKSWKTETKQSLWLRASPKLFSELGFSE
jgi:hypothetical protein